MAGAILEELCPALVEIVREFGWETIREERSESFDNATVELKCGNFAARVVRDRGLTSIDLSPKGKRRWFDLEIILAFIGEISPSRNPKTLSKLLARNYVEVGRIMTRSTDQLEILEDQRALKLVGKIFPPS